MKLSTRTVAVLVLCALPACAASCSTARVKSAVLARGYDGDKAVDETTTFKPGDHTMHLVVTIANAPPDTQFGATWTAVEAGGVTNQKIDATTIAAGNTSVLHFTLANDNDWPPGKYRVELTMNEKPSKRLDFTVQP